MVAWVITGTGVTGTHRRDYGSNHKKYYEGITLLCVVSALLFPMMTNGIMQRAPLSAVFSLWQMNLDCCYSVIHRHRQQLTLRSDNDLLCLCPFLSRIDWFVVYAAPKSDWCAEFPTSCPKERHVQVTCLLSNMQFCSGFVWWISETLGIKTFLLIVRSIVKIYSFSINSVIYSIYN